MTQVPASQIFEFLERQEVCTIEREEIALPLFSSLRRSLRQIALKLLESDDQETLEVSSRIHVLLCEWLTIPMPFDLSMLSAMEGALGGVDAVRARWGSDTETLYNMALSAANELVSIGNPLRQKLRTAIEQLRSNGSRFKIYCHRRARPHYESLFVPPKEPFSESAFLHSLRGYCETEPFDVLIKVGALRTRGWGAAPSALITAPRFKTLIQIVWSGCSDDADFAYDPVWAHSIVSKNNGSAPVPTSSYSGTVKWTVRVVRSGEDATALDRYADEVDELRIFEGRHYPSDKRSATLVQIEDEYGILYPPQSKVLSFDPDPAIREPVGHRIPGETLGEGMFLIAPLIDDVDFGGVKAKHGNYSQAWRARLEQEWRSDAASLLKRLQAAGLTLVHLNAAIRHWCKPPGTVIHAPQQMKHFEILLKVLGFDDRSNGNLDQRRALPFWKLAWNEIRHSRGEAIQTGFHEQVIIEEQLIVVLKKLIPEIRQKASIDGGFHLAIPAGNDVEGGFLFRKVFGIEDGFRAPETELRIVHELNLIDQWRD